MCIRDRAPTPERVTLTVRHEVSLNRGATSVEVRTIIDNHACDHRLQLLLPTDAVGAKTWHAHHPYDIVERAIAIDVQTVDWQEMDQVEKPMLSLQAVGDGKRGLALLCAGGLHEGGVRDDVRRTMQVTLLRAFRQTVSTGGEVDGQEQGQIDLRYALMPYAGELPRSQALQELARLQAGVLTRQSGKRPSGHPAMQGEQPATRSFVQQTAGELILSACKPAEEDEAALVVRMWNPTKDRQSATLRFWRPIASAQLLRLDESPLNNTPQTQVRSQELDLHAAGHAIVTVRVQFQ